ncbi:hypothetical protein B9Z55_009096 [Caenorhabditis nigoni]|uniref:MATH domain-containing protein n=1 Tax=Caenorhabditis nigoni TaxID=1611254 RepID=A0A2G5UQG5_9PELO|nr:hypothetical protein B9Z55_009096 [Caenorhabditis nigoni]
MSASDEEKTFVMKHVFKNVSSYEDPTEKGIKVTKGKPHYGPEKEHFGAQWELRIFEGKSGRLPFFILSCRKNARAHWEIDSEVTLKLLKTDGTWATRISDSSIGNIRLATKSLCTFVFLHFS